LKHTTVTRKISEIDCKSLENFIIDFLEDNLPAHEKMMFQKHIGECKHCEDYLQGYRKSIELSKAALTGKTSDKVENIPDDMVAAILAASGRA